MQSRELCAQPAIDCGEREESPSKPATDRRVKRQCFCRSDRRPASHCSFGTSCRERSAFGPL